jgi:hypothetical protein
MASESSLEWVIDSGSGKHLSSHRFLDTIEQQHVATSNNPVKMITANGDITVDQSLDMQVKPLPGQSFDVMILENAPPVLSLGALCEDHGFGFNWSLTRPNRCYMFHSRTSAAPRCSLQSTRSRC